RGAAAHDVALRQPVPRGEEPRGPAADGSLDDRGHAAGRGVRPGPGPHRPGRPDDEPDPHRDEPDPAGRPPLQVRGQPQQLQHLQGSGDAVDHGGAMRGALLAVGLLGALSGCTRDDPGQLLPGSSACNETTTGATTATGTGTGTGTTT